MITISRVADLGRMTRVENLSGVTFTGEEDGHKFVVSAMLDNAVVPLTGHVSGKFIRPNGATVALTESEDYAGIEEGKAWVVLAGNCYSEAGPFGLSITHIEGSKRTVIYACAGYIRPGETSSIVDPENLVNIDAIAAMMGEMEDATEDAEAAAAFVPNVIAPAYSTSGTYAVGDYCTKDGYMYRCNTAITTAEAWTAAHWTQVTTGAELGDLKSAVSGLMSATTEAIEQQLLPDGTASASRGYWYVENGVLQLHESTSGSYFYYPALAVEPGLYVVDMFGNAGHGPSIFLGEQIGSTDTYTPVSSITYPAGSAGSMQTYNIIVPETGVTHMLLSKYSVRDVSVKYYVQKTDATLTEDGVAADAKAVGDKFDGYDDAFENIDEDIGKLETQVKDVSDFVHEELSEKKTLTLEYVSTGYIRQTGECATGSAYVLRKTDVSALAGTKLTYTSEKGSSSNPMVMVAFYDLTLSELKRSTGTAEHCVGTGTVYSATDELVITEDVTVPQGALSMMVSCLAASELTPSVEYYISLDIKQEFADIENSIIKKKPRDNAGNIFFTVDCPRPIPFDDGTYTAQTDETIECVMRLPESYTATGKPTRMVLACHGAQGYIDSANDVWYNGTWSGFMNTLVNAGYGVFDANIFGGSDTTIIGKAYGSPLYIQVLKRAYDYIQENYNVYPQIFVHGTSMGGVGAKTFSHFYPDLVLAQSSFAGRDICLYLKTIRSLNYEDDRYYRAYGYASSTDLDNDKFSHVIGLSDSLGIMKVVDGAIVYPPDRETDYHGWLDYRSEINRKTQSTYNNAEWIGHTNVPYKSWNAWNDDQYDTAQDVIMAKAYSKTNSAPYYAVTYTLTDEELTGTTAHTVMSYGQVRDMRNQLIAWYRRWE